MELNSNEKGENSISAVEIAATKWISSGWYYKSAFKKLKSEIENGNFFATRPTGAMVGYKSNLQIVWPITFPVTLFASRIPEQKQAYRLLVVKIVSLDHFAGLIDHSRYLTNSTQFSAELSRRLLSLHVLQKPLLAQKPYCCFDADAESQVDKLKNSRFPAWFPPHPFQPT